MSVHNKRLGGPSSLLRKGVDGIPSYFSANRRGYPPCRLSQHAQLTVHAVLCTAHSACCPLMCALLSLTATSHCLQEKKKKTNKAAAVKKDDVIAEAKEEVKKQSKAEGKKAEGKG